jgi:hypothetical protein
VDVLPDPFSLPRIKLRAPEVYIMEVVVRCPQKSIPHVDGWRVETLRALTPPCTLTGLAKLIVNAEVAPGAASFFASATLNNPLDKLDPEQRRAPEQELRNQKGTLRPIGIGSVLVRFANCTRIVVIEVSQWLASGHQFGIGIRGGVEIVQVMFRCPLDASPEWADMQGDASNAFNEFLRRPLFEELLSNPALRPLLRVATMLHGRPSTLYVHDTCNASGKAMRIPSTRGVHKGCVLGVLCCAIFASRVYKKLAAIAPNESVVCAYSDDGHVLGTLAYLMAIGAPMPAACDIVRLTVTIGKDLLYSPLGVGDVFDNLSNGHIMRGVHVSTEGTKVLRGGGR